MGLPTMIKANMTNEQLEAYTLHLRIQEISEKLRINDVVPADGDRYVLPPSFCIHELSLIQYSGLHLHLRNTIILVVASTPASIATVNGSKMNAISRSRRR